MTRMLFGVLAGCAILFMLIVANFSAAYFVMGADRAFRPGSYEPTISWLVVSRLLGFLAAVVAGWMAASIDGARRAARWLAVLVVVIGILLTFPSLFVPITNPGPREGSVANFDAMQRIQTPRWARLSSPILGAAGVLAGASTRRRAGA